MAKTQSPLASPSTSGRERASSRSKLDAIVSEAVTLFGRDGYENSKWADVAAAVGIGSTALYHYFESKVHCLYVIMAEAVEDHRRRLEELTVDRSNYLEVLGQALRAGFELTDHEVLRMRVLVAEQGLIAVPRKSAREEAARVLARDRMRQLEVAWSMFLVRGMQSGHIPEADPTMLARAVLGLNTSVWHWYRPGGAVAKEDLADFFVQRQLAVIGVKTIN